MEGGCFAEANDWMPVSEEEIDGEEEKGTAFPWSSGRATSFAL